MAGEASSGRSGSFYLIKRTIERVGSMTEVYEITSGLKNVERSVCSSFLVERTPEWM